MVSVRVVSRLTDLRNYQASDSSELSNDAQYNAVVSFASGNDLPFNRLTPEGIEGLVRDPRVLARTELKADPISAIYVRQIPAKKESVRRSLVYAGGDD